MANGASRQQDTPTRASSAVVGGPYNAAGRCQTVISCRSVSIRLGTRWPWTSSMATSSNGAAFAILALGLALFAVLAGADIGVGVLLLVAAVRSEQDRQHDLVAYFTPRWEVHGVLLVSLLD